MKAIYIKQHGSVSDLKASEVAVPVIGPDEVLVEVEASGINPSDIVSVEGRFPGSVLPRIVGRDFAGRIVDGPAELVGTQVWGTGGDLGISRNGTHADYVALPRQAISRRPKNLSAEQAAAVGVPFVTSFSALVNLGKVTQGEWVIVSGAAGAVGQAAIQIAHTKGANVVALVKDKTQRWVSKLAGVQAVAESDQGDMENVVRDATKGRGVDLALNGVGSSIFGSILGALAVGGRQVLYSAAGGREATLDILSLYKHQWVLLGLDTQKFDAVYCARILNELTPLFESGALQPPEIGERYSLSEVAQAYGHVASGGGGKAVFVMNTREDEAVQLTAAMYDGMQVKASESK
jgi:NADPH:quinone reductase-like Zn-dependent oxidoreductase